MKWFSFIRVWDFTWWIWFGCAVLLLLGLLLSPMFFLAAIAIATLQAIAFVVRRGSVRDFTVQLRLAYATLLITCYPAALRWLYWVPAIGTFVMLFTGYCLLARLLSLLPWNRSEKITSAFLRRIFFRPPSLDAAIDGAHASGCPGAVCTLEVQIGMSPASATH